MAWFSKFVCCLGKKRKHRQIFDPVFYPPKNQHGQSSEQVSTRPRSFPNAKVFREEHPGSAAMGIVPVDENIQTSHPEERLTVPPEVRFKRRYDARHKAHMETNDAVMGEAPMGQGNAEEPSLPQVTDHLLRATEDVMGIPPDLICSKYVSVKQYPDKMGNRVVPEGGIIIRGNSIHEMKNTVIEPDRFHSGATLVFFLRDDRGYILGDEPRSDFMDKAAAVLYRHPKQMAGSVPIHELPSEDPALRRRFSFYGLPLNKDLFLSKSFEDRFPRFDLAVQTDESRDGAHRMKILTILLYRLLVTADEEHPEDNQKFTERLFDGWATSEGRTTEHLHNFVQLVIQAASDDSIILDIARPANNRLPSTKSISPYYYMMIWLRGAILYGGAILTAKMALRFELILAVQKITSTVVYDSWPAPKEVSFGSAHNLASLLINGDLHHWKPLSCSDGSLRNGESARQIWAEVCENLGLGQRFAWNGPVDECRFSYEAANRCPPWRRTLSDPVCPGVRHHVLCPNFEPIYLRASVASASLDYSMDHQFSSFAEAYSYLPPCPEVDGLNPFAKVYVSSHRRKPGAATVLHLQFDYHFYRPVKKLSWNRDLCEYKPQD